MVFIHERECDIIIGTKSQEHVFSAIQPSSSTFRYLSYRCICPENSNKNIQFIHCSIVCSSEILNVHYLGTGEVNYGIFIEWNSSCLKTNEMVQFF